MVKTEPLIIWAYHRILPQEKSSASCGVKTFERQIGFLRNSGYTFLTAAGLKEWFEGKLDCSKKYTMLTFDDGWADNHIWASPILAKFAVKALLALNTGFVNKKSCEIRNPKTYRIINSKEALQNAVYGKDFSSFLTWPELSEMKKSGLWDIHAHGNSHFGCYANLGKIRGFYPEKFHWTMEYGLGEPPFAGAPRTVFASALAFPRTVLAEELKAALRNSRTDAERRKLCRTFPGPIRTIETAAEFENRVTCDLKECRKLIKENLGVETSCLFWPWGQDSEPGRKIAHTCGFSMLFTTEKNIVANNTDRLRIPRIPTPADFADFKRSHTVFSNTILRKIRKCFT